MCWSNWYQHNCKFITDLYCICWLGWLKSERWFCQAAKEDALKIWNLLRVVRAQSSLSGSGRPRLLLQHEILPLEAQRVRLPLNLANKRSKEVVYPVRQRQSNQQNAFARQALNQHKASPINRVQMEKRFSGFRDLQRMNQLAKREEHTQALERPGNTITHWPRKEIEKYKQIDFFRCQPVLEDLPWGSTMVGHTITLFTFIISTRWHIAILLLVTNIDCISGTLTLIRMRSCVVLAELWLRHLLQFESFCTTSLTYFVFVQEYVIEKVKYINRRVLVMHKCWWKYMSVK